MPKFEIKISDRAEDWRETTGDAAMQSSSDTIQGSAALQCMSDAMSEAPPAALQSSGEPSSPTALQSVIG